MAFTCANCGTTSDESRVVLESKGWVWVKGEGCYCSEGCKHNKQTLVKHKGSKGVGAGVAQAVDGVLGGSGGSMSVDNLVGGAGKIAAGAGKLAIAGAVAGAALIKKKMDEEKAAAEARQQEIERRQEIEREALSRYAEQKSSEIRQISIPTAQEELVDTLPGFFAMLDAHNAECRKEEPLDPEDEIGMEAQLDYLERESVLRPIEEAISDKFDETSKKLEGFGGDTRTFARFISAEFGKKSSSFTSLNDSGKTALLELVDRTEDTLKAMEDSGGMIAVSVKILTLFSLIEDCKRVVTDKKSPVNGVERNEILAPARDKMLEKIGKLLVVLSSGEKNQFVSDLLKKRFDEENGLSYSPATNKFHNRDTMSFRDKIIEFFMRLTSKKKTGGEPLGMGTILKKAKAYTESPAAAMGGLTQTFGGMGGLTQKFGGMPQGIGGFDKKLNGFFDKKN
ncbi:MAG: hypothetical protein LBD07_00715 [Spirochaetaceae bacterium]|jgi:hypothetical protein|nr:hypothetical protein [Spirochaetaceae bacterium]